MSFSDIEKALYVELEDDILIRNNSLFVPYKSVGKLLEKVHSSFLGVCGIDVF